MNAIGSATAGMAASMRRMDETATQVANAGGATSSDADLAKAAADLVAEQVDFNANVAVARTGSRMTGRLLDIMA